jgi:hypothetical protein
MIRCRRQVIASVREPASCADLGLSEEIGVMAGLVPAIHAVQGHNRLQVIHDAEFTANFLF